jgi:LDH2 family malate/lactate/ureidoglycolate dehydrogenase
MVPGEPEQRERQRREAEGVPVAEATWTAIQTTAQELGVADRLPAVG